MWTHLSDTQPKARKSYRCELCDDMIAQGEKHIARRGINDDKIVTSRMHIQCESFTHDWDDWDWETADAGAFQEMLREHEAVQAAKEQADD